jgi:hypothetical protein
MVELGMVIMIKRCCGSIKNDWFVIVDNWDTTLVWDI